MYIKNRQFIVSHYVTFVNIFKRNLFTFYYIYGIYYLWHCQIFPRGGDCMYTIYRILFFVLILFILLTSQCY